MQTSKIITVKINVDKIDKKRITQGEKGRYLDMVLLPREDDRFGNDFMVVQNISKEEREQGEKGAILGNGKYIDNRPPKEEPVEVNGNVDDEFVF